MIVSQNINLTSTIPTGSENIGILGRLFTCENMFYNACKVELNWFFVARNVEECSLEKAGPFYTVRSKKLAEFFFDS